MDIRQKPIQNQSRQDLEFVVMPHREQTGENIMPPAHPPSRKKLWMIFGALGIVILLGVILYFVLGRADKDSDQKAIDIEAPLQADKNPDADKDGLDEAEEKIRGTNPKKSDTDGDGIADGDEVNVYGSDPLLSDTDSDTYQDGREVSGNFSPLINTTDPASSEEQKKWADRITQFGLHEPTITTIKTRGGTSPSPSPAASGDKTVYVNEIYKYSVELPKLLSFREKDSGQSVGVYITGTTPDDEDVTTDPISFTIASNAEKQPLADWIAMLYKPADYAKSEAVTAGTLKGIKLSGVKSDACTQDKTFYSQNGTVVVLTWTCNEIATLGPFYDEIIKSFKFQ